ncbi:hypothetical protein KIMH_15110 [Bombiscardovia apis]|uniref:Uncharacterized protein n=1 Tax=Bombiscardovia apis TaxID=2932182 RepID=A0ABM8BEN1_9BIFI|nr:hypothetical protein KIMH_15110 [Bombiscardovia apis]
MLSVVEASLLMMREWVAGLLMASTISPRLIAKEVALRMWKSHQFIGTILASVH